MGTDNTAAGSARSTHGKTTIMSNATTSSRPAAITRMSHYYQGRPNVMFLDRYNTNVGHSVARQA